MRSLITKAALALGLAYPIPAYSAEFYNQTLDDGTEAILIMGDIVEGDEERFRELSIRFPHAIVGLESDGGQLIPALEIGRLIRLRGYETAVLGEDICASACALIWMGGVRKTLGRNAGLGFHASYLDREGRLVESGAANALVGRYLTQLNYSEDTVLFATLAPPEEIWWLNEHTRELAGVDFEQDQPDAGNAPTPPPIRTAKIPPPAPPAYPIATLGASLRQEGFAARVATSMGATGKLHTAMADHLGKLYASDALIARAEKEMAAARIDFRSQPDAAGAILLRLSNRLVMNGLARLPQKDVNTFFVYYSAITRSEGRTCEVSLSNEGKVKLAEFRYVQALGDEHLYEYMRIIRKSIEAEAAESPARITLGPDQVGVAEAAWPDVLLEAVQDNGWSEEDFAIASSAWDNPTESNRVMRCSVLKTMIPAIATMEGMAGDWFRRVYLTYIQEAL